MDREDRRDADVIDHPVHFTALATELGLPPESLGESTSALLEELGYDRAERTRLREAGVVE